MALSVLKGRAPRSGKLEKPRPLRSQLSGTKCSPEPDIGSSCSELETLLKSATDDAIVLPLFDLLKVHGARLEVERRALIDRCFIAIRNLVSRAEISLDRRKCLLELIELRVRKWNKSPSKDTLKPIQRSRRHSSPTAAPLEVSTKVRHFSANDAAKLQMTPPASCLHIPEFPKVPEFQPYREKTTYSAADSESDSFLSPMSSDASEMLQSTEELDFEDFSDDQAGFDSKTPQAMKSPVLHSSVEKKKEGEKQLLELTHQLRNMQLASGSRHRWFYTNQGKFLIVAPDEDSLQEALYAMTKHFVAENPKVSTGVQTASEMCNNKQVCDHCLQDGTKNSKLEQEDMICNKPFDECPSLKTCTQDSECKNACCFKFDFSEISLPSKVRQAQLVTGQNSTNDGLHATKEVNNNRRQSSDRIHDIIASNLGQCATPIKESPELASDTKEHPEGLSSADKKSPSSDWVPRRPTIFRSISEPHTESRDRPASSIVRPAWKPNMAVGTIRQPVLPWAPGGHSDRGDSSLTVQARRAQFNSTAMHAKSLDSACSDTVYSRDDLLGMANSPVAKEINEEWVTLNAKFPNVFTLENPSYFDPDFYEQTGQQLAAEGRLSHIYKGTRWNPNAKTVLDDDMMSRPV